MKKLAILILIIFSTVALADKSKGGGGGDAREALRKIVRMNIEENISKIGRFLFTSERANKEFPEVMKKIDELSKRLKTLQIAVVDQEVYDRYNINRTAVNYSDENRIEYNLDKIAPYTVNDEEGVITPKKQSEVLFVLNFHELLGLLNLEENDPSKGDFYMHYKTSGRLAQFVSLIAGYDLVDRVKTPDEKLIKIETGTYYHQTNPCYFIVSQSSDLKKITLHIFGKDLPNGDFCIVSGEIFTYRYKSNGLYEKQGYRGYLRHLRVESSVYLKASGFYGPMDYIFNGPNSFEIN